MMYFLELHKLKDFLKISQSRDFLSQLALIEEFPETKAIEKAAQITTICQLRNMIA